MRLTSGILISPVIAALVAPAAMATVYLSPEQALAAVFGGQSDFKPSSLRLTKDQRKAISGNTGLNVRDQEIQVWSASDGTQMYIDKVVGKHEFITFAVGITADGKVQGVEILEYKETYGGEVRRPEWRKQFKGKRLSDSIKLGNDITNISGATLSSRSVTDGVKRLLAIRGLSV
jgi:Na+-translocating ferredoxin:NAD+ oxidoreductase RnfG subunit